MPTYPKTGSSLTFQNHDATFTGISTNIIISVAGNPVGAVQSLSITENRPISMVNEVGTDGSIDSTPTASTQISGTCSRIRYDLMRLTEAFGRGFLHILAQRIPFDIDIYDQWSGDGSSTVTTTIKNVWFQNLRYEFAAGNWIITDTANFVAETISSNINGQNAAQGGLRGNQFIELNSIERSADLGLRRGALDAPGLVFDFFSNV